MACKNARITDSKVNCTVGTFEFECPHCSRVYTNTDKSMKKLESIKFNVNGKCNYYKENGKHKLEVSW